MFRSLLQVNLGRWENTHVFLPILEKQVDAGLLFISESLRRLRETKYVVNRAETAAIWICVARIQVLGSRVRADYAWTRTPKATYDSVRLTSNCSAAESEKKIDALEYALRKINGNVIVEEDFSARARK